MLCLPSPSKQLAPSWSNDRHPLSGRRPPNVYWRQPTIRIGSWGKGRQVMERSSWIFIQDEELRVSLSWGHGQFKKPLPNVSHQNIWSSNLPPHLNWTLILTLSKPNFQTSKPLGQIYPVVQGLRSIVDPSASIDDWKTWTKTGCEVFWGSALVWGFGGAEISFWHVFFWWLFLGRGSIREITMDWKKNQQKDQMKRRRYR